MTVGFAILGAGIFAKTAHLPGVAALPPGIATLKAVYSRSEASARDLAAAAQTTLSLPDEPAIYHDVPAGSNTLDALLARPDIAAVVVVLPITTQPSIVLRALAAGKHVLSEKPVAADVRGARDLIATYENEHKPKGLIWRVAENFEMEPAIIKASEEVRKGTIGRVMFFEARTAIFMDKDNEYYKTPWRTVPDYQGGFLLDGGVHFAAALRVILPDPITHISGFAALNKDFLAPKDTINAVAQTDSGTTGNFTLTFASPNKTFGDRNGFFFAGAKGSLSLISAQPNYRLTIRDADGTEKVEEIRMAGVEEELKAFFERIASAAEDGHQNPRGALADLAFIQASLDSNGQLVDLQALVGECK